MKYIIQLIALVFISWSLTSCNGSDSEKNPHFQTIEDLEFTKFKKRKIKLEGELVFDNPTAFDIKMDAIGIDIYFNGKKVDNVQMKHDHTMESGDQYKQSFTSISKSIEVLPLVFGKSWKDFEKEDLEVEIKGQAIGKYQEKTYTIDIDYTQKMTLSKDGDEEMESDSTDTNN
ncbi:MAG: hypothetical protein KA797_07015 [Chitinophagales bacterium]|nr:hypothetical protein [Chitinophagales bacterium]